MHSRKRAILLVGVVAVGIATSSVAWTKLHSVSRESNPTEYWAREGARAYGKMASVSLEDTEAVSLAFSQAEINYAQPDLPVDDDRLDHLRKTARDFLIHRYTAKSLDEYIAWMTSQGYRLKTAEEFESKYAPVAYNAARAGSDATTVKEAFAALWAYPPSMRAAPTKLATGRGSVTIELATSNHNRSFTGRLSGSLGEDLWYGGSAATCRFWMTAPVTREDLLDQHGQVIAAQVGILGIIPDQGRHPVIVNLFLNPADGAWWIDGIAVTNFRGSDDIWTCCEY